ncbi:MAG: hypothetical protein RIR43_621 [Pseudomonadota bacterium]|jgi:pilus assembly protein CpaB
MAHPMRIHRPFVLLTLAGLAGLLALGLAARWLRAQTADHVPLVVANADIPLGTPLDASMLTTLAWPPGAWPEGGLKDPGALLGRVVRTPLTRHEPVLEAKLAALGSRGGLSAVITPGKRALTVKVNEVMGVAGFALPGSLVDVMVHTQTDADRHARESGLSKIVLERILVLAVAQDAGRETTAPRVASAVTLEVTPEEAERLDLARSVGSLSLVLRNPADAAPAQTLGARKPDLIAAALPPPPTPSAAPTPPKRPPSAASPPAPVAAPESAPRAAEVSSSTEVIRGTQRSATLW